MDKAGNSGKNILNNSETNSSLDGIDCLGGGKGFETIAHSAFSPVVSINPTASWADRGNPIGSTGAKPVTADTSASFFVGNADTISGGTATMPCPMPHQPPLR